MRSSSIMLIGQIVVPVFQGIGLGKAVAQPGNSAHFLLSPSLRYPNYTILRQRPISTKLMAFQVKSEPQMGQKGTSLLSHFPIVPHGGAGMARPGFGRKDDCSA